MTELKEWDNIPRTMWVKLYFTWGYMKDWNGNSKAVFVLPEKEKHINIHNYCLHLFYSAENPLPDFTGGTDSI